MLGEAKKYLLKFKSYVDNHTLITNLLSKLIITFGVVLIVGGLYLMITDPGASSQIAQISSATQSAVSIVNWVPGIPFYIGDLASASATSIGLVSWVLGIDFLLIGLGFWVRSRLACLAGLMTFVFAGFFQLVQFLDFGVLGSPISVLELCVDGIFAYFLLTKFDSQKPSPISSQSIKA